MTKPRILLTGPVGRLDDYTEAVEAAGWHGEGLPLVEIVSLDPLTTDDSGATCDWIAITSSNALPWLARRLATLPELKDAPCAVVGARSAERVEELGLRLGLPPAADAETLGRALASVTPRPVRVLWPRGPLSHELGERLRAMDVAVDDPLAYEVRELAPRSQLPAADAVFFASPSAVRRYATLYAGESRADQLAVAIGGTTFDALLDAAELGFCDTISLPEPTPEGLRAALEHVHRDAETSEES